MGKVNVYFPAEMEREMKERGVPISAICQNAMREALSQDAQPNLADLLTVQEEHALNTTRILANQLRAIIGTGPQVENDWAEAAAKIHDIQHMIMAQAAARAFPDKYRLLGRDFTT